MSKLHRIMFYAWFWLIVKPIVHLLIGVAVFGRHSLNLREPSIIVANHNSHLDALVLMDLLPARCLCKVRPVAAADYFEKTRMTSFIWRWGMNVLPIRRDKVTRTHNPLQAMVDRLDAGESLLLFPEGTRGEPERLSKFQTGIAHVLEKRPNVPVIPVLMRNLGFSMPRGNLVVVPLFCDVFIGKPRQLQGQRAEVMRQLQECFDDLIAVADRLRVSEAADDDR
jgi:1-acyl-sn-glycerol-3-phosphate acyltransferase